METALATALPRIHPTVRINIYELPHHRILGGAMISARRQAYAAEVIALPSARPLCVDLDGTLVKSDTLVDSLLFLVRTHPLEALKVPLWALEGKAALKSKVASLVSLVVEHLPYNSPLLAYLL